MRVYENGQQVGEVSDPSDLGAWASRRERSAAFLSLDLHETRQHQERVIRAHGREWFEQNISPLEQTALLLQVFARQPLSAEQQALRAEIEAAFSTMQTAIQRVRSAADWRAVLAVEWAPPARS